MNTAQITRGNYLEEAVYFIPTTGKDWIIESLAPDYTVKLSSETDSAETLDAYLATHAALAVNATQATITADSVDSTLISVANGQPFSFRIMRYNIEVHADTADGVLEFSTSDPAEYLFELKQGNATGYAKVIAHD